MEDDSGQHEGKVVNGSKASPTAQDLQILFSMGTAGTFSDGQLLGRFVDRKEEAVFEEIVRRHGPMVWGVCRRVLRDHHDAEDAFQATFLVLARRAASIAHGEKLGNWLYGVAYQTARKARTQRAKKQRREGQVPDMPEPMAMLDDQRNNLAESIDRELSRLPEKYRIPIVLCELEGRTHHEAASQLGWPVGTVSSRLSRARAMLARQLSRQGLPLSAGSLVVLLAQETASASMPTQWIGSTAQAASRFATGGTSTAKVVSAEVAQLTEEVSKTMMTSSGLRLAMMTMVAALLSGVGLFVADGAMPAVQQADGAKAAPNAKATPDAKASTQPDTMRLQGVWSGVIAEFGGRRSSPAQNVPLPKSSARIRGDELTLRGVMYGNLIALNPTSDMIFKFKIEPDGGHGKIDLTLPAAPDDLSPTTYLGIYRLEGEDLTLCLSIPNKKRPQAFTTQRGTNQILLKLKRGRKDDWEKSPKPLSSSPQENDEQKPAEVDRRPPDQD